MLLTRWQHGMYLEKLCVFYLQPLRKKGEEKRNNISFFKVALN